MDFWRRVNKRLRVLVRFGEVNEDLDKVIQCLLAREAAIIGCGNSQSHHFVNTDRKSGAYRILCYNNSVELLG